MDQRIEEWGDTVGNYPYMNEAEREWTQKYEGSYTRREIELNKQLAAACSQNTIDFALIEDLLKQGADPLGGTALFGWDLVDHIYGDVVALDAVDNNSVNLPRLTELFLKHGMNVDKPRIPYDLGVSINPMWFFSHIANENTTIALKMLLDHGLSAESFAEFWDHSFTDYCICDYGDPQKDPIWNYEYTWTMKMLMLGASYAHILNVDTGLKEFICYKDNRYDLCNFRHWNDYEYFFDTSHCLGSPHIWGSVLHIFHKESGTEVWKMGIGRDGRKALEGQQ